MRQRVVLFLIAISAFAMFAQSLDAVKADRQYLWGEGWGTSVAEADKHALADLISKIAVKISSDSKQHEKSTVRNGTLEEESQFSQSINTYSQATLTNTERVIIHNEPDAHVGRWIKRKDVEKIFESRKHKILDMVRSAENAQEKGKVDDALRNYYWALTLLKSLQYPNEVTYTTASGKNCVLTSWIPNQMDEIFDEMKATVVERKGDDVELFITYKGKPVNSVDYTYFDGQTWSNIYSAKDGRGVLELVKGHQASQFQIKYEYEYFGEAQIDKEVESVLNVVKGTSIRSAYAQVSDKVQKKLTVQPQQKQTFTKNDADILVAPKMLSSGIDKYANPLSKIVSAINSKNYDSVRGLFTAEGWEMYTKLIHYGNARVLDSHNIRFFPDGDAVLSRGLRVSFSFARGVRKAFVEDVVLRFNSNGKIENIAFGLGDTAEDDIFNKGVWNENARMAIMNFLENYKTAYALKRLDYIESVFDDDAVIITGTVIKKTAGRLNREGFGSLSANGNQIIKYNRHTKDEYIKKLARTFANQEFINIRFANNDVIKLNKGGECYAIQIQQDYYSTTYGDKGYLFLIVDINDPEHPSIKVRTWQPDKDPNFGVYSAGDF